MHIISNVHQIQSVPLKTLFTFSLNIFTPALIETSFAEGNVLHRSNQAAIFGYLLRSPPSSWIPNHKDYL